MRNATIGLGALVLIAGPADRALAQAVPDIQDAISRGDQIDDAIRGQERFRPRPQAEESAIDGEAGVFVMALNEIFYVGGSLGGGWSENPLRTVDDVGGSAFVAGSVAAGVQTRLGQAVDAGLAVSVSGTQYAKKFAPSSRTLTASANVGTAIGGTPLYIGLTGFGGFNYDDDFKRGTGFYGGAVALSTGFPAGPRTVVRPSISGGRQMGDIRENNSWNVNASLNVVHMLTDRLSLGLDARLSRTWFDDFYEDATFVERRDWDYGGSLSLNYRAADWLVLSASGGYQKRDSSFFLSKYEGFETQLSVSARLRF